MRKTATPHDADLAFFLNEFHNKNRLDQTELLYRQLVATTNVFIAAIPSDETVAIEASIQAIDAAKNDRQERLDALQELYEQIDRSPDHWGNFVKFSILARRFVREAGELLEDKSVQTILQSSQHDHLTRLLLCAIESLIAAFENYGEYLFPGKSEDLAKLFNLLPGLLQFGLSSTVLTSFPDLIDGLQEAYDDPNVARLHEINHKIVSQSVRSETARTAGSRPKPANPQRLKAIELYVAKTWRSALHAARTITPEILSMPRNMLGDRAEKTIHEWLLDYDKSESSPDAADL